MKKIYKFTLTALLSLLAIVIALFLYDADIAVLNPKGLIALKEKRLIVTSTLLMLIVVIPVFILMFFFMWKYKASNTKAKYSPDWGDSWLAEAIWWGVPFIIIFILSVMTWESSHELDPFKPLDMKEKPVRIQVVALQWKWLFIYPEEGIATVNFVQFPERTPINFEITADAPMNSFWIPQLGSQIYAMPGMKTKLHLIADEVGSYRGSSANLSGKGFAGMQFIAKSSSAADFAQWVESVKHASPPLNREEYDKLALPSENNPETSYLLQDENLYDQIVMKFMMPQKE